MKIKALVVMILVVIMSVSGVYADDLNDLNGVGGAIKPTTSNEQQADVGSIEPTETESSTTVGDSIGDAFKASAVDAESMERANRALAPVANAMNFGMALLLGLAFIGMSFVTVLDLVYMAFPPIRDMLDGGKSGMANMQGGGMGHMGGRQSMGNMGGGMDGMDMGMGGGRGMGRQQQPQQHGGGLSAIGRWISDEAVAACLESSGGPMGATMGMQSPSPIKSMVFSYLKKRSIFLILYAICVVLLTSTIFTDLGIKVGLKLLGMLSGQL